MLIATLKRGGMFPQYDEFQSLIGILVKLYYLDPRLNLLY
ncbi:hypothetical protein M595_0454 [Lyngbya aestuarii BL J]|uniref:Uncharacterized protein n=1 Tax=Lyngbya aestuarii BL J TaxID=1348334 RepID=U7QNV0_9CYAN|nr:hypothetical protein M595_0454 [Lyngbya aestuarii BL J]